MIRRCDQMFGSDRSRMTGDLDRYRVIADSNGFRNRILAEDISSAKYRTCSASSVLRLPRFFKSGKRVERDIPTEPLSYLARTSILPH
jgi:hypothetical protein